MPVLFLAHGSSVSSRPSFDLTVPGHDDYSLMNKFAEYGFDVWTMDFEGYGRSGTSAGNSDFAAGADDIKAAAEVIVRETGQPRFHLMGESSGALRAGSLPWRILNLWRDWSSSRLPTPGRAPRRSQNARNRLTTITHTTGGHGTEI